MRTMTSRERLVCALRGGTPDRIPVAPLGLGGLDAGSPIAAELLARTDCLSPVRPATDWMHGVGEDVRVTTGPEVTRITYQTEYGPLVRRIRLEAGMPVTVEWPVRGPEDLERLLSLRYTGPGPDVAPYRHSERMLGDAGVTLVEVCDPASYLAEMISPHDLSAMWTDHRGALVELLEIATARMLAFVWRLCDEGVQAFRVIGCDEVALCVGPRSFSEMMERFDTDLVGGIHRHGGIVLYDQRGPILRHLPTLAALGVDAVGPLDGPPWGDVGDLAAARLAAGPAMCLVACPFRGDEPRDVRPALMDRARRMAEAAGPAGFVLGGCPADAYGEETAELYLAMADMAAKG